jgi:mannose-1-phosphate guanylyltransferase
MVLAAGHGTRLRPLTDMRPKPLVPVGDRPLLDLIVDGLQAAGVARVVVNAHHRGADLRAFARARAGVAVSEEDVLLGTAGGVARARGLLGPGAVLVWNGDIVTELDVHALAARHVEDAASPEATLVVAPLPAGKGAVGLDRSGRVVRLRDASFGDEAQGGTFIGVHVLGASLREALPETGCLVADLYIPALARGAVLRACAHAVPFFDAGSPRGYLDANLAWLAARRLGSWRAPSAAVSDGITLVESIVGADARVEGKGELRRCVVWPGAAATAPATETIFAGNNIVRV